MNRCRKSILWGTALICDKNTQQSGNRGSIPQHNKGHIWKTYSQHHTQWAKTKSFPTKMSSFITSIQHSIRSPSHSNQTRKRNIKHPNWKEGSKTVTVCRWHNSVHRKPYRFHQKNLPDLISEFGKEVGYKVNIHKLISFLYTNNEISEKETRGGKSHLLQQK